MSIFLVRTAGKLASEKSKSLSATDDVVARQMGFSLPQQEESSRNLRFSTADSEASWRFIAKFPRCGHWAIFGADGPDEIVPDGGCCPLEGFLKSGQQCSGHGSCVVDSMTKPNPLSFLELEEDEVEQLDEFTIRLTQKEQQESLGGNWAKLIEEAERNDDLKCEVKLKAEFSAKVCKKGETWGCVDDGENDKMWVRKCSSAKRENLNHIPQILNNNTVSLTRITVHLSVTNIVCRTHQQHEFESHPSNT